MLITNADIHDWKQKVKCQHTDVVELVELQARRTQIVRLQGSSYEIIL